MRTVKFRGQRVDNGEWIIGGLVIPDILLRGAWICPSTTFADLYPDLEEGENISNYKYNGITIGHFHEVRPETVGQFTGLTDKNEKEVFEGDLLRWFVSSTQKYAEELLEVRYRSFGFVLFSKLFKRFGLPNGHHCTTEQSVDYIKECEVIGNIFQNPELLK